MNHTAFVILCYCFENYLLAFKESMVGVLLLMMFVRDIVYRIHCLSSYYSIKLSPPLFFSLSPYFLNTLFLVVATLCAFKLICEHTSYLKISCPIYFAVIGGALCRL